MLERQLTYRRRHQALALTLLRGGLGTDPEAWQIVDDSRWDRKWGQIYFWGK